jgi:hypothetical protein
VVVVILLDNWVLTSLEALRTGRAIWALQRAATPEAQEPLKKLAEGAPEARETPEAQASLELIGKPKR